MKNIDEISGLEYVELLNEGMLRGKRYGAESYGDAIVILEMLLHEINAESAIQIGKQKDISFALDEQVKVLDRKVTELMEENAFLKGGIKYGYSHDQVSSVTDSGCETHITIRSENKVANVEISFEGDD